MTTTELYPDVPPPTPEDMTIDYGRDYKFWSSRDTTLDGLRPSIVTILSTLRIAAHHARRAADMEKRLAEAEKLLRKTREQCMQEFLADNPTADAAGGEW